MALKDEDRPNLKALDDSLVAIQAWALEEINTYQKVCTSHFKLTATSLDRHLLPWTQLEWLATIVWHYSTTMLVLLSSMRST